MKKLLFFAITLNVSLACIAQHSIDSLWGAWRNESLDDTLRSDAIRRIAWQGYLHSDPDSTLYYTDIAYKFAESKGLKRQMALCFNTKGAVYYLTGEHIIALDFYQQNLEMLEEIGEEKFTAPTLNNIGLIYRDQGQNVKALDYFLRSLKLAEENEDYGNIANSLNNIGTIYSNQKDYKLALDYYNRSLAILNESGNKQGISNAYSNIGLIYRSLQDYQKALEYMNLGLKISEETGDQRGLATILNNIGLVYDELGNYNDAITYYNRSLDASRGFGDKLLMAVSLINIGQVKSQAGNQREAIEYCFSSLQIAEEMEVVVQQRDACECLYEAYKKLGRSNEALKFHEKVVMFDKTLEQEETVKKLQQMEFEKQIVSDSLKQVEKEMRIMLAHEVEIYRKNRTRNILIASALFVLIIAALLYWSLRYTKQAKKNIEKERDLSESLLLNILPEEIAEELKIFGKAEARDFDMVSIIFTDFKGFTEFSTKLSAQELVAEINECFKAFDHIVVNYGIEKIKTIGDAYMAAGGIPVKFEKSVKNSVLAALDMQEFIEKNIASKNAQGKLAFDMRVGIHTGPVVAGIVGVKKFQYDIWGDTVNIASRMESSGEVGRVNISSSTYEILKNETDLKFECRGKICVKGKGEMQMYFVEKQQI